MAQGPIVKCNDGTTMSYSNARSAWEAGELSDWVNAHGGFPLMIGNASISEEECDEGIEDALSDDQWD
jgi:hypothetical protein